MLFWILAIASMCIALAAYALNPSAPLPSIALDAGLAIAALALTLLIAAVESQDTGHRHHTED